MSTPAAEQQLDQSEVADQVRNVLVSQQNAWNRGDIEEFMNGYARSESTMFVSGGEITRGWQLVRDRYVRKYGAREKMGTLTFSELEITPLAADATVAVGRWELKRANDNPHGRFTLILRRSGEGWRIVYDHTSSAD